jgi:hypothetical protein
MLITPKIVLVKKNKNNNNKTLVTIWVYVITDVFLNMHVNETSQ